MKKSLVIGLAIGLASLVSSAAFAGSSAPANLPAQGYANQKNTGGAGIVGSSHDMSNAAGTLIGTASNTTATYATTDTQKRICVYCHHPHNALSAGTNGGGRTGSETAVGAYSPLWNRTTSTTALTGYDNGIMMGNTDASDSQHHLNAGVDGTSISGVSLLCMSCHDGVTAMNAYSVNSGSTQNAGANQGVSGAITSSAAFKGNMNNHHPMGFSYSAVQATDEEIAGVDTVMVPDAAAGSPVTTGSVKIGDLLYGANKTMECVTCHDVHNTANKAGAERFLWRSDNNSNFCLTCHLK